MLAISVARFLAQTLSNMVTANEVLMTKIWETYMNLPEDQVVLMYESSHLYVHTQLMDVSGCSTRIDDCWGLATQRRC